jgi:hypothetical protein
MGINHGSHPAPPVDFLPERQTGANGFLPTRPRKTNGLADENHAA